MTRRLQLPLMGERSALERYLFALLAAGAGVLLRTPIWGLLGTSVPFITFFPAVMLSAWVAGLGPGLLTTALSALIATYLLVDPVGMFGPVRAADAVSLGIFVLVGAFISWLTGKLQDATRSERQLRLTSEQTLISIGDAVIATDAQARITFINRVAEQLTGWRSAEAIGRSLDDVFSIASEGTEEAIENPVTRVLLRGDVQALADNTELISRDGKRTSIEDSSAPIRDSDGRIVGAVLVFRNITDRKRAEALARETEQRLKLLAEANVIGIVFCDIEGNVRDANDEYLRILGYTREDLLSGRVSWASATPPEWLERDWQRIAEAVERGTCSPYEKEYIRSDGTRIPVYVGFVLLGTERKDAVAFVMDLTAQKNAEAALRESEANLHLALKASRMGVWTNDLLQKRVAWSPELEEIFGVQPGAFGGTEEEFFSYIHPDDRAGVADAVRRAIAERTDYIIEFRFERANGEKGWMEGRGRAIYDEQGSAVRLAGVGLDISHRKLIEQELRDSETRLRRANEELQQFTYAVGHDLREPLRTVTAYVQLLDRRYRGTLDEGARELIEFAVQGAKRMQQLIEALLEYSRAGEVTPEKKSVVRLDHALDASLSGLNAVIEETAAIITRDELPEVQADALMLTQVLQNLISNALKYSKTDEPPRVHVSAEVDGTSCVVSVRDNGQGIAAEHHERIFGVFQRLHGREIPGTGLGLATCKRIVERWGGRMWVQSDPGVGSTFRFSVSAAADQLKRTGMAV